MSEIRDGLKCLKFGLFGGLIVAMPLGVIWGVVILMTWLQKAVGL